MRDGSLLTNVGRDEARRVLANAEETKGDTLVSKKEIVKVGIRQITEEEFEREALLCINKTKKGFASLSRALNYMYKNTRTSADLYVQCVRIGDVYYYALPGEIFVNFGLELKKKSPSGKILITDLAHAQNGYIPTKEAFLLLKVCFMKQQQGL